MGKEHLTRATGAARRAMAAVLVLSLGACGFWGGDKETVRTPGERVRILGIQNEITVDAGLKDVAYRAVPARQNLSWPQRGASSTNAIGALEAEGFTRKDSGTLGDGEGWTTLLATAPVIADGVLYGMDARGYVSAHVADDLGKKHWVSDVPVVDKKEDILGGGLAVAGKQLFVTTGQGDVFALNTEDGSRLWHRGIGVPVRAAPKLSTGTVYVTTVDDQLFALDSASGGILWQHRGMGERVGFLSAVSPAIGENIVVMAYSSGELYGLAADTGQELWSDSLTLNLRTTATSIFTGFDGDPVIAGGVVFAASNNGLGAATHLLTGRRVWEREVSAADTPWLAGNYLFVLTSDSQVAALYARDGRVKWVHELPRYRKPERQREPYRWYGPMLFGEQLAVFSGHGELVLLSPQDGEHIGTLRIPDDVRLSPVVAGGVAYVVTGDAKVHALR